jgi:tetratricopeptide (TPR) repeat protein
MKTLAIVIGISKYNDSLCFSSLPGAKHDAIWIERILSTYKLGNKYIKLLVDESATKSNVITAIRQWALEESDGNEELRLLIFFSGHGSIVKESNSPEESVLITYDTEGRDKIGTGITLIEFVRCIKRLELQELYIFIDACFMSIDSIAKAIGEIPGLDLFKRLSTNNCFFCMIANNKAEAFETRENPHGVFTSTLLDSINTLSNFPDASISKLAETILNYHKKKSLGNPAVISAGATNVWPFNDFNYSKDNVIEKNLTTTDYYIERPKVVRMVIDKLRKISPNPLIFSGQAGIGKTTIINEIAFNLKDAIFIRLEKMSEITEYLSYIVCEILNHYPQIVPSQALLSDIDSSLQHICDLIPDLILCLDGFDNLPITDSKIVIEKLIVYKIQLCIAARETTTISCEIEKIMCPCFSRKESIELLKKFGINAQYFESYMQKSRGNPLLIKEIASKNINRNDNNNDVIESSIEVAKKLYATGGYMDIDIFCNSNNVEFCELEKFEQSGYIYLLNNIYVIHDEFIKKMSNIAIDDNYYLIAFEYWRKELRRHKYSTYPARKMLQCMDYLANIPVVNDIHIANCIKQIRRLGESLNYEKILKTIVSKTELFKDTLNTLSMIFSEIGSFKNVELIYSHLHAYKESRIETELAYARACWWKGDYKECIELCCKVIEKSDNESYKMQAYLEAGISYFFLGNWIQSTKYLKIVEESDNSSAIVYGWSKLILGTTDGIRGKHFDKGKKRLEASINLLKEEGDITGLAIAYGNLGEILWKHGDYELAERNLQNNLIYAKKTDMYINLIENKRNQLQLEIRWHNPFTEIAKKLLADLAKVTLIDIGNMEMMQVANTVATAFLYQNKITDALPFIKLAEQLTCENDEYRIYTLGNKIILHILTEESNNVDPMIDDLLSLSIKGENYLAIKQIRDDVNYIKNNYNKKSIEYIINKLNLQNAI